MSGVSRRSSAAVSASSSMLRRPGPGGIGALPRVTAEAWAVTDEHGRIIGGSRHSERRAMASLTKIATAAVVLRLSDGAGLSSSTRVSKLAAHTLGTSARLREGDVATVWALLHGLMLPSGNDAAIALAEHFNDTARSQMMAARTSTGTQSSPSSQDRLQTACELLPSHFSCDVSAESGTKCYGSFVYMMNAFARECGAYDTHFVNPHGMDQRNHRSTVQDVLRMARRAMGDDRFRALVCTREACFPVTRERKARASPGGRQTLHTQRRQPDGGLLVRDALQWYMEMVRGEGGGGGEEDEEDEKELEEEELTQQEQEYASPRALGEPGASDEGRGGTWNWCGGPASMGSGETQSPQRVRVHVGPGGTSDLASEPAPSSPQCTSPPPPRSESRRRWSASPTAAGAQPLHRGLQSKGGGAASHLQLCPRVCGDAVFGDNLDLCAGAVSPLTDEGTDVGSVLEVEDDECADTVDYGSPPPHSPTSLSPASTVVPALTPSRLPPRGPHVHVQKHVGQRMTPPRSARCEARLQWTNTNKLLGWRAGCAGIKTGVTRTAGPCLCTMVTAANGRHFYVCLMRATSMDARFPDTLKIVRWAQREVNAHEAASARKARLSSPQYGNSWACSPRAGPSEQVGGRASSDCQEARNVLELRPGRGGLVFAGRQAVATRGALAHLQTNNAQWRRDQCAVAEPAL